MLGTNAIPEGITFAKNQTGENQERKAPRKGFRCSRQRRACREVYKQSDPRTQNYDKSCFVSNLLQHIEVTRWFSLIAIRQN